MKLKFYIVLLVLANVVAGKSECVTYLECLGSFFDNFFSDHIHFNLTKASDVPDFGSINLENDDVHNILSGVSSFLGEELKNNDKIVSPNSIFQNVNNNTAIYVKTIIISDSSDNINEGDIAIDSDSIIKNIESFQTSDINVTDLLKPFVNLNSTTFEIKNITYVIDKKINDSKDDKLNKNINENEIPDVDDYGVYYDNDNTTDYPVIDYVDLYKDTTNEYIDITQKPKSEIDDENNYKMKSVLNTDTMIHENETDNGSNIKTNTATTKTVDQIIFPWVAAIFIKNNTSNQFDYYCDGALVSTNAVLTAARCVHNYKMEAKSEDLLVLLGKTSLNSMNEYEIVAKVKEVIIHDNYTKDGIENDIAILVMEDPVVFNERIQAACLGIEDYKESITTAWAVTGELTLVTLDANETKNCNNIAGDKTYCVVYGSDVQLCPSHGGLHVARDERYADAWRLRGIRHADPNDRGICFDNNITFTDLNYYLNWIDQYVQ